MLCWGAYLEGLTVHIKAFFGMREVQCNYLDDSPLIRCWVGKVVFKVYDHSMIDIHPNSRVT